jgi:hypothetical protein
MRKLMLSLPSLLLVAGAVVAGAQVVLVRYDKDKQELTAKDSDGKEHTFKVTDKTTVLRLDKDGNTVETKFGEKHDKALGNWRQAKKLTVEKGAVSQIDLRPVGPK